MRRVLCVLLVVILGIAAVRFPQGYGADNSAYLHRNEESELDNTQNLKSNVPADSGRKGSGLTESQKEGVINLCSTSDNSEHKTEDVTDKNKETDSVSVTDDEEKLDERYMKMTDDSNQNGFKNSDKQVNSSSKTDNDLTISQIETTSTNSNTAPITIGLSGSIYITEKSRINENNNIDASSCTNSASLIESISKTPHIGGSKLDTKEATIPIKSDSISHDVHTSDNKISDSSFDHLKSTTESINHQDNYSAVSSHTTGDSIAIVKPIPSSEEVNKNEHISGANNKDKIQTYKNKENSSIILVIVNENKYGRFEIDKERHEIHHYNVGHRYSHESDSSDNSDESDESWGKDHNSHQYDGHHHSHKSDSSDDSSIESNERWKEGHNFRVYGHEYDNNDAAADLGHSWVG